MITLSQDILNKINNPIQLPSTQGEPILIFQIYNPYIANGALFTNYQNYIKTGSISYNYDGYAYSTSLTMYKGMLATTQFLENSIFQPGSRIKIFVTFGENQNSTTPIGLFSGTIDEMEFDMDETTFSIGATGDISHNLKECTMGNTIQLTGFSHEVGEEIMELAEVPEFYITIGDYEWTYTYKPSDSCMAALEQMYPIFPKDGYGQPGFGILEKPGGGVVFGYWRDRTGSDNGIPVGTYSFNEGREMFKRNVRYTIDKCYKQVFANGKAADGVNLEQVVVSVENAFLNIPESKIYHANFNGYTMQDDLEDWAETIALELQNAGITQQISGPFRPQITVGDIAQITGGEFEYPSGVITSITHHIGTDGFSTDFTIETSGVIPAVTGWTSNMKANGYNRRQNLVDTTREIAEQVTKQALGQYDQIKIEDIWNEEEEEEKDTVAQRNEVLIEFDGRNWQDLLENDEEEEE